MAFRAPSDRLEHLVVAAVLAGALVVSYLSPLDLFGSVSLIVMVLTA